MEWGSQANQTRAARVSHIYSLINTIIGRIIFAGRNLIFKASQSYFEWEIVYVLEPLSTLWMVVFGVTLILLSSSFSVLLVCFLEALVRMHVRVAWTLYSILTTESRIYVGGQGKTRTLREKVLFLKNKAAPLQGYINTANSCSTIEAEHSAITTLAGHQSGSLRVPSSLWHAVSPCWRGCALSKQPCLQASSQARCAAAVWAGN